MYKIFLLIISLSFETIFPSIISGYIYNNTSGAPIPNANVYIIGNDNGTASDPHGYFILEEYNKNEVELEISVIGFKRYRKLIPITDDKIELEIQLIPTVLKYNEVKVQGLLSSRLGNETITIIKRQEIQSSENESLTDYLKSLPSVDAQFAHPNGRNTNISIRGSSDYKPGGYNNRVLVLLDGFPILIPNSGSPDWNSIPLENIKRIEINNNSASTQYGHNSMGGVINLITDYKNEADNIKVNFTLGSHSTYQSNFIYNKTNSNFAYGLNGAFRSSQGHRYNADSQINRLQAFIKYNDFTGRNYRLSYLVSSSNLGHPGFDLEDANQYRRSNRTSHYIQLQGFYAISSGLSMSHSLFYNNFYTHYTNRDDIPKSWIDENNLDEETFYKDSNIGLRSEIILTKLSRWVMLLGLDLDLATSDVDLLNPIYDKPSQFSIGSFLQSKYSIGNGFNLSTGLRYDWRKTDPGGGFQKKVFNNLTPKFILSYNQNKNKSFSLCYSEGFRAPSISELYLEHQTTYGLNVLGNNTLKAETVKSFEITHGHKYSDQWEYNISLFHNKYNDMIDFVYNIPTKAANRSGVIANGFEYSFSLQPLSKFNFFIKGSYSYLDMNDKDGTDILYRSKYSGNLSLQYSYNSLDLIFQGNGKSKQLYEDFLEPFDSDSGFPVKVLPQIIIPDLIISKKTRLFNYKIKIANIFNQKYELIQNYTMPSRTYKITINKTIT
jgi:outer membrane cobalamin receptor